MPNGEPGPPLGADPGYSTNGGHGCLPSSGTCGETGLGDNFNVRPAVFVEYKSPTQLGWHLHTYLGTYQRR